jgi:hypothetical protein
MRWTRAPDAAISKVTVAALAITCGAILGIGAHWTAGLEPSGRTQVTATILEPAEPDLMRPAIGQWTTPEGETRFGVIPAPPGLPDGAAHPVWVDETGHITDAPEHQVTRIAQASLAGMLGTTAVILLAWPRQTGAAGREFASMTWAFPAFHRQCETRGNGMKAPGGQRQ